MVLALSGGVDSVVLLDVLVPLSVQMQFELSAIHVNHGISANAGKWNSFCQRLCCSWGILLKTRTLKIIKEPGLSLEAISREGRYCIFGKLKADYVVLAQHLDDQAETLMLQLLRGAGVKGLCAMPVLRRLSSGTMNPPTGISGNAPGERSRTLDGRPGILRPMLHVSRREIEDYAREHALQWITDESNDNTAFDRNFLRHDIFPQLEKRFPSYRIAFLRASRHMAEASALLDEVAESDSRECVQSGKILIESMRKLGFLRAKNLLRHTLARQGAILPSAVKLEEILRQLLSSCPDTKLHVVFGSSEVRCFRGLVYIRKARPSTTAVARISHPDEWRLPWQGEKRVVIAELGGTLRFTSRKGVGISFQKLTQFPVTIRLRRGGERLRPDCNRPRRSVKNLLQEAAMPPWERETLPLIFSGDHLAGVPGIGVSCEFQAAAGEEGVVVEWQPRNAVQGSGSPGWA